MGMIAFDKYRVYKVNDEKLFLARKEILRLPIQTKVHAEPMRRLLWACGLLKASLDPK